MQGIVGDNLGIVYSKLSPKIHHGIQWKNAKVQ
jgi:hypothetical protein